MSDKFHVPESQWRKEKRKQRFKNKKRSKRKDQFKHHRGAKVDDFDDDLDVREWQDKWRG